MSNNLLLHADNLIGLNYLLNNGLKGKIDLVYIDPPYATGGNFTITNGRATTISNSKNGKIVYTYTLQGQEFIDFLRQRLILIKELMPERGSIYLHIDYKIRHYVKMMMDKTQYNPKLLEEYQQKYNELKIKRLEKYLDKLKKVR